MKCSEIFKCYNVHMMKKNRWVSCFVMLSIIFSVMVSLAIPQVVTNLKKYWEKEAYLKNGAALKIECKFYSEEFEHLMQKVKEENEVKEVNVFNAVLEKDSQQYYCDLLTGDYGLAENEMILSQNMSDMLKVSEGDFYEFQQVRYKIKEVEKSARGVGKQAEEMGYAKISRYAQDEKYAYEKLYFVQGDSVGKIKEDLEQAEDAYTYMTVEDVEKESEQQIVTNAMSLSMMNTMGMIMTVISLISSIFLILSKCERDIAIMKIESVRSSAIRKAFQKQFYFYLAPSVILGAVCSVLTAYLISKNNSVNYQICPENTARLFVGILFLLLSYTGYVRIACRRIDDIEPLSVLKAEETGKRNGHIIWRAAALTFLVFFLYSLYIGVPDVFAVSLMIMLLLGAFYLLFLFIIRMVTCIRAGKAVNRYFIQHMRQKRHSVTLTVMSLSFTILFFLIGFTLSGTIADCFTQNLEEKINYNYIINTRKEEDLKRVIKQNNETGRYTKINVSDARLYKNEELLDAVMLCAANNKDYKVKYRLTEGEDVVDRQDGGVMVSAAFAGKYDYSIKDQMVLEQNGRKKTYRIDGIYESGGMNDNHIIIGHEGDEDIRQNVMYLVQTEHPSVLKKMDHVSIVTLSSIGSSLGKSLDKMLRIFKTLCVVCIFAAIIFNINIMYLKSAEDHRDFVLMRAVGLHRSTLVWNVIYECAVMFILTIVMSLGVFYFLIKVAVNAMFGMSAAFSAEMIVVPLIMAACIIGVIFSIPFVNVGKSNLFDELREAV